MLGPKGGRVKTTLAWGWGPVWGGGGGAVGVVVGVFGPVVVVEELAVEVARAPEQKLPSSTLSFPCAALLSSSDDIYIPSNITK